MYGLLPPSSPSPLSPDGTLNTACAACGLGILGEGQSAEGLGAMSSDRPQPAVLFMGRLWHRYGPLSLANLARAS